MAGHSSILAWRIPWTEEPGGLQSRGHKELDMTQRLNNNHNTNGKSAGLNDLEKNLREDTEEMETVTGLVLI